MGCGSSKDPKIGVVDSIKPVDNYNSYKSNYNNSNGNHIRSTNNRNGFRQVELKASDDIYSKKNFSKPDEKKAPLAFVIQFDENKKTGNLHRPPPGRLQLEPLKHIPNLTQEKLDEKMKIAERNREQILAKRVKSSKSSKKRNSNQRTDDDSDYYKENSNLERKTNHYDRMPNRPDERRSSEEEAKRERLLKARRIIPNKAQYDYDDDEIEHDKNYNRYSSRNDDDF